MVLLVSLAPTERPVAGIGSRTMCFRTGWEVNVKRHADKRRVATANPVWNGLRNKRGERIGSFFMT